MCSSGCQKWAGETCKELYTYAMHHSHSIRTRSLHHFHHFWRITNDCFLCGGWFGQRSHCDLNMQHLGCRCALPSASPQYGFAPSVHTGRRANISVWDQLLILRNHSTITSRQRCKGLKSELIELLALEEVRIKCVLCISLSIRQHAKTYKTHADTHGSTIYV